LLAGRGQASARQQILEGRYGHGLAEQVAVKYRATMLFEEESLRLSFNTFGDDDQPRASGILKGWASAVGCTARHNTPP
jgi:hypothetical protein